MAGVVPGSRFAMLVLTMSLLPTVVAAQGNAPASDQQPPYAGVPAGYSAETTESKPYLAVRLGAVIPKHKDLDGFDNGFAVEGAVGYRVNQNVAVELDFGRFAMSGSGVAIATTGIGTVPVAVTEDIVAYPLVGTLKLILPVDRLEVFGLAGAGLYFLSVTAEAKAAGFGSQSVTDSDSAFGFHFGGGMNLRVAPHTQLGAQVKYIMGTATVWDSKNHFDSLIVGGALTFTL